ncbi:MAG TPA: efflux RND transporter periplasmic adaptor subunit [Candidatus Paceibacterota bacterium]|nr:efflux RND transporter periplasmic adaptor subunit [Candidatus Paceibacterota bacterium]
MKKFFIQYRVVIGIVVVAAAAGGAYWYVASTHAPEFGTITVAKGNVVQSIDEPGTVAAENSAPMSFQEGGQIAHVYVTEGSQVAAGTVLADLNAAQLNAASEQASAALGAAEAQLALLQSGTRPEQLQIDQSAVSSADQTLGIAVENAYSAANDAVTNQLDNLFSNPNSANPEFLVVPSGSSQGTIDGIQSERVQLGGVLASWYAAVNNSSTAFDPATIAGTSATDLQQVESYINSISLVVNAATPTASMSASTLAAYKTDISTARTEVQASVSAISGDQSALTAAKNQLALAQAGSTPQAIQAQQAVVAQAQAASESAAVALQNASLVAPFAGTVQNLTAQLGQVVSPGAPVMNLVNNSGLKVQTYVSETDVANVKSGEAAVITLDAFGTGTTFPATVTTVDAAQTMVNGAPAYLVTLHFTNPDSRLKDGMSGNVHIIEAEHDNVIAVPSNLVINNDGNYFVLMQGATGTAEQPVQIGLVGASSTEITSGLNVGDKINSF